jgi:Fe-S oxidoreductase
MSEYGYRSPLYGHYGQGCVHLRINFDFKTIEGLRKFREFLDRAADLVVSLGGSLSGEHGDGQARAVLLPKMFGPELMQAFQEFKAIWDPDNRMNPGKLVDAVRVYDPVENLRYGLPAGRETDGLARQKLETHFVFAADQGSMEDATARCVGVGACLKKDGGVMCPSYRATGLEQHSTRGRARLLWEMLAGALKDEGFKSEAVHEALDLCLSCKACKTECPVQVDMAQYKSEFLAQKYKGKLHPLHHYVFGFADKMAHLGSLTPTLTNFLLSSPITSPLIKHLVGVAKERQMPRLARKSYKAARVADETSNVRCGASRQHALGPEGPSVRPQVVLWADTWNNYYHPQALAAAESVLTQAGFRVQTTKGHICCGRALYDFGMLGTARGYLAKVLDHVAPEIEAGLPFIFLEPSCASVFKDEALELFPNDTRAQKLSNQVWLLADWLAAKAPDWVNGRLAGAQIILHGHCHHKAVFGGPKSEIALLRKAGAQVEMIDTTCCGMAGPFGFEVGKVEVSKAIANLGLLPAVNGASPMTLIVADGFSCREQIAQLSDREGMHFAEILDRSCGCGG